MAGVCRVWQGQVVLAFFQREWYPVPRPRELQEAMLAHSQGKMTADELNTRFDKAVRETIESFEATGSPVVSDGEQTKSSFATHPVDGLDNLAADGVVIPFQDGHTRQLPRLTNRVMCV